MNYADYKMENLVFLKGEADNWTEDEKREFLDTCPESKNLEQIIEELRDIKTALDQDVIKKSQYGDINKSSFKAYLKKHDTHIEYGRPNRRYFYSDDSKDFFVRIDGSYRHLNSTYQVCDFIAVYDDGGNIEKRFSCITEEYRKKESEWAKKIENERYNALNKARIDANRKLYAVLSELSIDIPVDVTKKDYCDDYYCQKKRFRSYDMPFYHNSYGEVTVNDKPLSEEKATELYNAIIEMSEKIKDVVKEYEPVFESTIGSIKWRD